MGCPDFRGSTVCICYNTLGNREDLAFPQGLMLSARAATPKHPSHEDTHYNYNNCNEYTTRDSNYVGPNGDKSHREDKGVIYAGAYSQEP